jgi:putative ubiquitin-RnfH superfamily antitoxin RatB of RatAB toxin-antitoxin module
MTKVILPTHADETIHITVAASKAGQLWQRQLSLPVGTTIAQSIIAAGYLKDFPENTLASISVGIFGKHYPNHQLLQDHDRVEIYAPLRVDPKIARRRRAAHREKTRNIKKKMPVNDLTQS